MEFSFAFSLLGLCFLALFFLSSGVGGLFLISITTITICFLSRDLLPLMFGSVFDRVVLSDPKVESGFELRALQDGAQSFAHQLQHGLRFAGLRWLLSLSLSQQSLAFIVLS